MPVDQSKQTVLSPKYRIDICGLHICKFYTYIRLFMVNIKHNLTFRKVSDTKTKSYN